MKRAIITGATGFVGSNLARRLVRDGHEVHLLVRKQYDPWRIADFIQDVSVHVVDFSDAPTLESIVGRIRAEWIFHLATYGAYSHQRDLSLILKTNVNGTVNLLQACMKAGFETFINTGSSSEYGFKDHPPSEQEWLEPNSHYAVSKAFATMFCRNTARSEGVRVHTLRLYSVYGPFEEPIRFIPTIIVRGLRNELPPLVQPQIARDYVFVEDVVDAYLAVANVRDQDPGAVYNVGTGTQTTVAEVVDLARRSLGITEEPNWGSMDNRMWDTGTWISDSRYIRTAVGWVSKHSFESGFLETIDWMREIMADPRLRAKYEIGPYG